MQIPQTTAKVDSRHILVLLAVFSAVSFYVLWPSSSQEPCAQNVLPFWNGEYPEPVVVIREKNTVQAYKTLCMEVSRTCTLSKGMIHPWSQDQFSYASKPYSVSYLSRGGFSSDLHDYEAGTELIYEGETPDGLCSFRKDTDRWNSSCHFLESLEHIAGDLQAKGRQFFLSPCTEGGQGWVEVNEELFRNVGIDRGFIKGYGVISAQ